MIKYRKKRMDSIVRVIRKRIRSFSAQYRSGPSLYFYRRVLTLRKSFSSVSSFLKCNYCMEVLYATLASWDMNTRSAKMKSFPEFKRSLKIASPELIKINKCLPAFRRGNYKPLLHALEAAYNKLKLMDSHKRLISNSKCLHFIFPEACMPMDGKNTLFKLYGNNHESCEKYLEITEFVFDVMRRLRNPSNYLDKGWNTCLTKVVDNALILMETRNYRT